MASNINRVIDYYVSRNRLSIQKAYLIGHSTSIKGFATLLSNELNMPIEKVERLKNIALDKKAYVEEATLTSYVTNLGAVIDPVDFIPKRLIESGARKENTKTLIVGFVGALVVSALLVLIPLVQVVALNAEIGSLNKSIKKLSIINDVVNEYYSAKDKYNDIAKHLQHLHQTAMMHYRILLIILKRVCQVILLFSLSMLHQEQLQLMEQREASLQ